MTRFIALFVFLVLCGGVLPSRAMETDQFNLPPAPLVDIAPEVEAYVAQRIQAALDKLNAEIAARERCANGARGTAQALPDGFSIRCGTQAFENAKLGQLRSPDAVAKGVYDELGTGTIFHAQMGLWLTSHKFEHEPARYTAPFSESIYVTAPINYATLSPTIRVYGVEFGTDKFDHLFQQGYTYYRRYTAAKKDGRSDADALKSVVAYGRSTENLFFGYAVSGVYSNADLAANIAGLKFYQNLANDIDIAGSDVPPILKIMDGRWLLVKQGLSQESEVFTANGVLIRHIEELPASPSSKDLAPRPRLDQAPILPTQILRPFITDHLNEAYNPSNYLFFLYPVVKSVIKKHACAEWRSAFPTATRELLETRSAGLKTWNGLDYGYKKTSRQPRVGDLCFNDERPRP